MIFIVSDAHFGSDEEEKARREKFFQFLEMVRERGERLILLGDIFDFWFEYRHHVNRHYLDILFHLKMTARHVETIYVAGNHDLWIDGILEDMGIRTYRNSFAMGNVLFAHGDNLKVGFKTRDLLLNPVLVRLFYMIHPDWGYAIARAVSTTSRRRNEEVDTIPEWMWKFVLSRVEQKNIVVGHLHVPMVEEREGKRIVCIGEWMRSYNYGVIEEHILSVKNMDGSVILSISLH